MFEKDQRPLEALVHRALRELPPERAPATLEARVLARLAARCELPWWQAGWQAWPILPRVAVMVAATLVAVATTWLFLAGVRSAEAFDLGRWAEAHAPWLPALRQLATTLADVSGIFVRKYHQWVIGGAVVMAGAYAMLIALGSGLYRSLHANR